MGKMNPVFVELCVCTDFVLDDGHFIVEQDGLSFLWREVSWTSNLLNTGGGGLILVPSFTDPRFSSK